MKPAAPLELLARAAQFEDLSRWERAELGRALRRLGWTYGEIRDVIPVPKGTLSYWCREIRLSAEQIEGIKARVSGSRRGVPVDTQWRRRLEIAEIKRQAAVEAESLLAEPLWTAGVVLYWGEGAKTSNELSLANSDPRALRLFVAWVRHYHDADAAFSLKINLHADNDEPAARRYWRAETGLPKANFHKTFIKPDGTGHRKNHLAYGVCMVRMRRGVDALHRTLAWIDVVAGLSRMQVR